MGRANAIEMNDSHVDPGKELYEQLDAVTVRLVSDLQTASPTIFWIDMLASAAVTWAGFAVALAAGSLSLSVAATLLSGLAAYRGLCFIHEITHIRRGALPGFETTWNLLFGVPLLLPSFTYQGVHQSHHTTSTYGTLEDPEYLPFAYSQRLILVFSIYASVVVPLALMVRFLVIAPIGLLVPPFHRWLDEHASSFAMNRKYLRRVDGKTAGKIRRWELAILVVWVAGILLAYASGSVIRVTTLWYAVLVWVSFLNTLRVLGAHRYDSDGSRRDRRGQVQDSIDTPGHFWTELWAPVGLRYHALHHYFPGIPYHNLGKAYRRCAQALSPECPYVESTSPSLWQSLRSLYARARERAATILGW